jgi:hypothetical protein
MITMKANAPAPVPNEARESGGVLKGYPGTGGAGSVVLILDSRYDHAGVTTVYPVARDRNTTVRHAFAPGARTAEPGRAAFAPVPNEAKESVGAPSRHPGAG